MKNFSSVKIIALLTIVMLASCGSPAKKTFTADDIKIIPKPVKSEYLGSNYELSKHEHIYLHANNAELKKIAQYFVARINESAIGFDFHIMNENGNTSEPGIHFILNKNPDSILNDEGYNLEIDKSIVIKANTPKGVFYGVQSLLQLFPEKIWGSQQLVKEIVVPKLKITDYPRFKYRGMHLDVGRHFFTADSVKRYIDLIAMHKMNTFHWHLTEDQGWRIEIKKYPKLTEIGSKRPETVVEKNFNPYIGDGIPVEGYYTQEEIKEIVKYAQERFITVIPEIELPGHSQAALASYPHLGCTGVPYEVSTVWGVTDDVYCAGNDSVFQFMEDVLTEVLELFPSEYIHIGGDECPKSKWKECPKCQARIKTESLKDEHELQSYFITRIEKFLNEKGRNIIGWDEILEGGLAPNATVMSWRGMSGGIEAAKQKHDVVMTPGTHCYFDHYQADPEFEPLAIGGYTSLKKVYSFEPVPEKLTSDEAKYILGAQGNVWTEYLKTYQQVEYMTAPRISALAEVVWSTKESKNWNDFQIRIKTQLKRFDAMNVNYGPISHRITFNPVLNKNNGQFLVSLETEEAGIPIRYTLDGTTPTLSSTLYTTPILIDKNTIIKADAVIDGKLSGRVKQQKFDIHKAVGAKVSYANEYSAHYSAGGDMALVDGVNSPASFNKHFWQGFEGIDMEVIMELKEETDIRSISVGFLHDPGKWIYRPDRVTFFVSTDGKSFVELVEKQSSIDIKSNEAVKEDFICEIKTSKVKFIKVEAKGIIKNPEWHSNAGENSWLFVDEIIVE